jgi:hypothetical protein
MTDGSRDLEAIEAARGLTEAVQGTAGELAAMRRELAAMNTYGKHNRRFIAGLAISFALDIVLTIVVAVFAIQAHDASSQAHVAAALAAQNHASALTFCRAANVSAAAQVRLTTYFVAITQPPPGAPGAQAVTTRARDAALLVYVRRSFAPRDCAQIYGQRRLPGTCPAADLG